MSSEPYPIGTPGQPWGPSEVQAWLSRQAVQRSYREEVLERLPALSARFEVIRYGALPYDPERYPLYALRARGGGAGRPTALVTGGVHGYETSGVQGALRFAEVAPGRFLEAFDLVIAPCVSPWGYETINRWNPRAQDPNRSFKAGSDAPEAAQLMAFVAEEGLAPVVHVDLHETTDTDATVFRPALAARDGRPDEDDGGIPDGFYLVDNARAPTPEFQAAIIAAVEAVTHIAPPDADGRIIGCKVVQRGVIHYDKARLGLCGGMTAATYVTTTEVYPDSQKTDPETCIRAQVAAVSGALEYVLAHGGG
ncbi:MAG: M14 family metallocarboxypeptidase [Myxococcales bacterium]|nr:M14 family metallocarboxypeptidase [Myxococcales bacterium]